MARWAVRVTGTVQGVGFRPFVHGLAEDLGLTGLVGNDVHGVFIEVLGVGVLLTGKAGVGKSELALELISRGSRLIADDAPEFVRDAPDRISGYCPATLTLIGCQPEELEDYGGGLRDVVAAQIDPAIAVALDRLAGLGVVARAGCGRLRQV